MNKEKLEELLNDLYDDAHGDSNGVEIPNAESVIEEAYNVGWQAGYMDSERYWLSITHNKASGIRSEPTTGAGLVQEVDDCIDKIEDTGMKESYRNARLAMKGLGLE
ncbi:MAG: hypothetical protein U1D67_04840 [Dehalococcoidia bacterium]|nr:hypothetical protein [Dehalococcoidia bacterium]